jgi:DNA-binding transcriptional regulator GbsR (MarR family)
MKSKSAENPVVQVYNIRHMPNIQNIARTAAGQLFIDDVARLLMPWGVPQAAARLYGYLLLCSTPASLDRITVDLEISKSSASVAARLLEKYTVVLRHGERGSKRVLYEASDNFEAILSEQKRMLRAMAELLKAGARTAASGAAHKRLELMAEFYLVTFEAMETALQKWGARRSK